MGSTLIVGISDCKVSGDANTLIKTYALGSCIGVAMHDYGVKVGGLLHLLLPYSIHNTREMLNPYMFADTGIGTMVREMITLGANPTRITARIAGGANMLNSSSVLDIGRKNIQAVMDILERAKIPLMGSSAGGTLGRSMEMDVGSGRVLVHYLGGGEVIL